jgi:hypothetical protein
MSQRGTLPSRRPEPRQPLQPLPEPRPSPRESAGYIPWWMLAGVTFVFAAVALALAGLALLTRTADLPSPTATVIIVTAASAAQTPLSATATIQSPPTVPPPPPTSTAPPPPPGEVKVGVYVQVVGTGDAGFLNLRAEPSTSSAVNYLAIEHEVFQVQAGPTQDGGFTWWYIVNPTTPSRYGWAVQNYLQQVQGPNK